MTEETSTETLLIVEDEQDLLRGLKRLVAPELKCGVLAAGSARQALELLESETVDVVLADIQMPDINGMELLERIKNSYADTGVILMTAFGSIDLAVEALKKGAYDFVTKPLDEKRLIHTLNKCLERQRLIRKTLDLQQRILEKEQVAHFVGSSPPLQKVLATIPPISQTDLPVLITGESGTGKELAAKTIHALSKRGQGEMVTVNCPVIPEAILESELFGYKKGAFTDARQDKKGLIEKAHGSTLFLDEIGDLPQVLQAKFLRLLQEKEIKPLGDNRTKKVDVRIIAATNRNLQEKIKLGEFREDLYYRLNVFCIEMPALREMREDIPLLADYFLEAYCRESELPLKSFSTAALRHLADAAWKGNVRELQNAVKRAAVLCPADVLEPQFLDLDSPESRCPVQGWDSITEMPYRDAKANILEQFTVGYVAKLLGATGGNVSSAARKCGLERQSFQHLMRKYGIQSEPFKKGRPHFGE